ncbi:hypothetical protein BDV10DRAFT_188973 [Aspergillus recurvatus]
MANETRMELLQKKENLTLFDPAPEYDASLDGMIIPAGIRQLGEKCNFDGKVVHLARRGCLGGYWRHAHAVSAMLSLKGPRDSNVQAYLEFVNNGACETNTDLPYLFCDSFGQLFNWDAVAEDSKGNEIILDDTVQQIQDFYLYAFDANRRARWQRIDPRSQALCIPEVQRRRQYLRR